MISQVTTVSSTSSTIFRPSGYCTWVTIQNNGTGNVRLSMDGQSVPTASTGYLLAAGSQITIYYSGSNQRQVVYAILTSATTTTLDLVTPDTYST